MNTCYTGTGCVDISVYGKENDGRIDSNESLTLARANAKQFGLKRKIKMEVF